MSALLSGEDSRRTCPGSSRGGPILSSRGWILAGGGMASCSQALRSVVSITVTSDQCYVGSPWCGDTHWPVVTTLLVLARWRQQSVMCNMSHVLLEVTNILFSTSTNYHRTVLMRTRY